MLPGSELVKAVNPVRVKGDSILGKLLAPDEEFPKILE